MARGILVRSKDEMKAMLGRSPDAGDAVCLANFRSMKLEVWEDLRRNRRGAEESAEDLYRDLRGRGRRHATNRAEAQDEPIR